MEHVERSRVDAQVVNFASPDTCNPILTKVGLGPIVGAGTIDTTVQGIRWIVSRNRNAPLDEVSIKMVIHRAHRGTMYQTMPNKKTPHYLRIFIRNEDVTAKFDTDRIIADAVDLTGTESLTCPNTTNAALTAASGVRNVIAILNDSKEIVHAPGVNEMPGGVPARIGAKGAEIALPEDLSYEKAFKINQEGMKLEGIDRIEKDGAVVFTDALLDRLKGFGINYAKSMSVTEIVEKTQENIRVVKQLIG